MLLGQTVNVATGGVAFVLVMAGFTGIDLADNLLAAALLFALAIPLAAAVGPTGAAAASAAALAAVNVVRLIQVAHRVGVQPFDAAYARLGLPAAGCALAAWAARAGTALAPLVGRGGGDDARRRGRLCGAAAGRAAGGRAVGRGRLHAQDLEPAQVIRHVRRVAVDRRWSAGSATIRRSTSGGWSRRSSST